MLTGPANVQIPEPKRQIPPTEYSQPGNICCHYTKTRAKGRMGTNGSGVTIPKINGVV